MAPMWIRVEGIPLTSNHPHGARRALEKLGRVITFDNASLQEGPKEFLRVKVQVQLDKHFVPGYFYEYQIGHFQWVDFRYEGIFRRPMREVCINLENLMVQHLLTPVSDSSHLDLTE